VDCGHQTFNNAEVLQNHLGDRSQAVSGAGRIRNDVIIRSECLIIDAENNSLHTVALTWGRNDDFFRAGFDVPPGFRVFDKKAGAFDHDVHAQFFPRECSWPFADGERLNFSAVDNECVVALGFDSALEAALRRVILKQVSKIFSGNEVVNCDHFDFAAQQALFNKGAKDKATDAAESVNSNFCSHLTSVF
jgi:hypothetical protein